MTNDELNLAIGVKVMGWHRETDDIDDGGGMYWMVDGIAMEPDWTFDPSTDIANAWRVVEKLEELGWLIEMYSQGGCWSALLEHTDGARNVTRKVAETAPLVICTVALVAIAGGDLDTPADA